MATWSPDRFTESFFSRAMRRRWQMGKLFGHFTICYLLRKKRSTGAACYILPTLFRFLRVFRGNIEFINMLYLVAGVPGPRDMATETANISKWKIIVDLFKHNGADKNWPFATNPYAQYFTVHWQSALFYSYFGLLKKSRFVCIFHLRKWYKAFIISSVLWLI